MAWTRRDDKRLEQQSRKMASEAQQGWARAHPVLNCCFTLFALGFLGALAILIALGAAGFFDHLG